MGLWDLRVAETGGSAYLSDRVLSRATGGGGVDPNFVRQSFFRAGTKVVEFEVIDPSGDALETIPRPLHDYMIWGWIPIFSARAMDLIVSLGGSQDDFWPCRFRLHPQEDFGLFLPLKCHDIVDIDKSTFLGVIPATPPIPINITNLVIKYIPDPMPPCFRACVPGHSQVFGELFVSDLFKIAWERQGLIGAKFCQLL